MVCNGTETLTFSRPRIWEIVPDYINRSSSLEKFKFKIKIWNPVNSPCRLCKRILPQVVFLNMLFHFPICIFYDFYVTFLFLF